VRGAAPTTLSKMSNGRSAAAAGEAGNGGDDLGLGGHPSTEGESAEPRAIVADDVVRDAISLRLAGDRELVRAHGATVRVDRRLPLDVRRVVGALSVDHASSTVHTVSAVFQSVISAAVDAEVIPRTPCRGIALPQLERKKDIRFLTPA